MKKIARPAVATVAPRGSVLTRAARQDLYQDTVNESLFMRPGQYLTRLLVYVDNRGIDGAVNGLAADSAPGRGMPLLVTSLAKLPLDGQDGRRQIPISSGGDGPCRSWNATA